MPVNLLQFWGKTDGRREPQAWHPAIRSPGFCGCSAPVSDVGLGGAGGCVCDGWADRVRNGDPACGKWGGAAVAETYYAHGKEGEPPERWQLLKDHLRGVAELARKFALEARPGDEEFAQTAYWAGMLHDLGKYTDEFQKRLMTASRGEPASKAVHSVHGAAAVKNAKEAALAILGHHAGFHCANELNRKTREFEPSARKCMEKALAENKDIRQAENLGTSSLLKNKAWHDLDIWMRMLMSVLVDADRLDTARFRDGSLTQTILLAPQELLKRLLAYIDKRASQVADGVVKQTRKSVLEHCLNASDWPERLLSLTVPTGGGKTLSSLAFALQRASIQKGEIRRIIVVIPFLSIIEQNAGVLKEALGENVILEHHSGDIARQRIINANDGSKYLPMEDDENPSEAERIKRLAVENWDAPIVVTTSVRFFESLFSNHPSDLRRVHNIARSVVILDEVQTLPRDILRPLLSVMETLSKGWGTHFLFCTATQPAFEKYAGAPDDDIRWPAGTVKEIIPDRRVLFSNLQRVVVTWPKKDEVWAWDRLADEMEGHKRALCIVNTKEDAKKLYEKLCDRATDGCRIYHLSTRMCAQHRLDRIREIKAVVAANDFPCLVVSTQLVEAGVDLDFPVVFRAMGPLDAIAQAAGRCDREGIMTARAGRPAGQVIVFETENRSCPSGIYREATEITRGAFPKNGHLL